MPEDGMGCQTEEEKSNSDLLPLYNIFHNNHNTLIPTQIRSQRHKSGHQPDQSPPHNKDTTAGTPRHTSTNSEAWGDRMNKKRPHTLRLALANVDSLPMHKNDEKNDSIARFCVDNELDFLGMTEPNKCWHLLPTDDRIHERFYGYWENMHASIAYNKNNPHAAPHQVGGAVGLSFNQAAHRIDSTSGGRGQDPTGLGRWTWTRFRGRDNVCLRVAVVYAPCKSSGPLTAWSQQMAYFNSNSDASWRSDPNPRHRLFTDLSSSMDEWIETGDQVIIMGDWNMDTRDLSLVNFFKEHGMHEVLLAKHGQSAPATCNMGSSPIDGIWATIGLEISNGGFCNFEEGLPGNHRTLWIDLTYQQAFGHRQPAITRKAARRLQMSDPRVMKKYIKYRKAHARKHNLRRKHIATEKQATYPADPTSNQSYEANDAITVEGMHEAERKCRRFRGGGVPWSPVVEAGRRQIALVRALIKRREGKRISSSLIRRREKQLKLCFHTYTLPKLKRQLRTSLAAYYVLKAKAPKLRDKFIEELANARAAANDTTRAAELRIMESRRQQRALGSSMRTLSGKGFHQPLTSLTTETTESTTLPDGSRTWTPKLSVITEKVPMEKAALDEYSRRLHLTTTSPPMIPPLVTELGYLGIGPACKAILDGTYIPPAGVDPFAGQWLSQLDWATPTIPSTKPEGIFRSCGLTTSEHVSSWKHAKERTSPGHSGLHPAHWKVSSTDPYLATMDAAWANYPLLSGYSPSRWRRGVDTLIPKKSGSDRVEDLRPILLFEIDCNMANKRIGRAMMEMAERNGSLSKEQYGSRKDHSAGIQALNHRLAFDLLRLEKRNAVDTAVDLRSCYDLIAHAVASLSMQRQGVPEASVVCMFTTLQNMVHTVRTAFGDSTQTFGGDLWAIPMQPPPQGVGQGNGAGPAIWAVVSTPVLEMMRSQGHGAVFRLAISPQDVKLVGFAFVDDSDIIQTATHLDGPIEDLLEAAQAGLNCFVGGMNATGGQVNPKTLSKKCWWYLIHFEWKKGRWSYAKPCPTTAPLTVRLADGTIANLSQKSPSEAAETLGIWLAPDGNNKKAIEALTTVSRTWADQLRTRPLPRTHAWLSMLMSVSKKLEYPLVALTLTEKECKSIERPLLEQLAKSCGYSKSFPHLVIHGPIEFQGMGRKRIYYVMGEIHLEALLRHYHEKSITGSLLQAALERHNLELGTGNSLLQTNYSVFSKIVTSSWMKHTWKFIHEFGIKVGITAPTPVLRREHDRFLVTAFQENGFRLSQLATLNRCRLFLRVSSVSDISSGDGSFILENYWLGHRDTLNFSHYRWPGSGMPSSNDWSLWRRALRSLLYDDASSVTRRRLRTPLGCWTDANDNWPWWYSPHENRLYKRHNTSLWSVYTSAPGSARHRQHRRFNYFQSATHGPFDGLRTKVIQYAHDISFRPTGSTPTHCPPQPTHGTCLQDRLQTMIPTRMWAMERLNVSDNGQEVARAIQSKTAISVSDGSFKLQHGTAGFVLAHKDHCSPSSPNRIMGCHVTPGAPTDQSPYRSELSGIYAILCVAEEICDLYSITTGGLIIGCDNEKSIWMAIDKQGSLSPKSKSFDLISAIRKKIAKLPISITSHWVKGHQDNFIRHPSRLDTWATLNIEMDSLAKLFWEDSYGRPTRQHSIHDETHAIYVNGQKLCGPLSRQLYSACEGPPLQQHWVTRGKLPLSHLRLINWEACGSAAKLLGVGLRFWKTKHVAGIFANGKFMERWKFWSHSKCPRCQESDEDASHVIRCPVVTPLWPLAIAPLTAWLVKAETPPDIMAATLECIRAWRTATPSRLRVEHCTPDLAATITAQDSIGWQSFFEGFLAIEWELLLDRHFDSINSRRSGRRWCAGLIHQLWLLIHDLWVHRNTILHDIVPATTQIALAQLHASISNQYNQGLNGLSPTHFRSYFSRPLRDLFSLSETYKRNWLTNLISARDHLQQTQPGFDTSTSRTNERRCLQAWLDLPRCRRAKSCRLRPIVPTNTQSTPASRPTRPKRPYQASSTQSTKRKRYRPNLPVDYSFVPIR